MRPQEITLPGLDNTVWLLVVILDLNSPLLSRIAARATPHVVSDTTLLHQAQSHKPHITARIDCRLLAKSLAALLMYVTA